MPQSCGSEQVNVFLLPEGKNPKIHFLALFRALYTNQQYAEIILNKSVGTFNNIIARWEKYESVVENIFRMKSWNQGHRIHQLSSTAHSVGFYLTSGYSGFYSNIY